LVKTGARFCRRIFEHRSCCGCLRSRSLRLHRRQRLRCGARVRLPGGRVVLRRGQQALLFFRRKFADLLGHIRQLLRSHFARI